MATDAVTGEENNQSLIGKSQFREGGALGVGRKGYAWYCQAARRYLQSARRRSLRRRPEEIRPRHLQGRIQIGHPPAAGRPLCDGGSQAFVVNWSKRRKVDVRQGRADGSGAASCRETGVFRDFHGTCAISRNPRCIGGGGRRSRFVNPSHRDMVAFAITGDEFSRWG